MNDCHHLNLRWKTCGFTLLELSIVLIIISLVTAMAFTSGIAVIGNARQSATVQKIAAIEDALVAYRTANDRLPCPASLTITPFSSDPNYAYYGVEGASPGTCTGGTPAANFSGGGGTEGAVPTVTLGLPNDFMYDGWGNRIRYAVTTGVTAAGAFSNTVVNCIDGSITMCDNAGVSGSSCINTARSTNTVYALISHGANGHGAYTKNGVTFNAGIANANEQTNCQCDVNGAHTGGSGVLTPIFVQQSAGFQSSHIGDNTYYFDDIVTYKESWQLQTPWDSVSSNCPAIYVADNGNRKIQKFDINGKYITSFSSLGSSGLIQGLTGIAIDISGNLWALDTDGGSTQRVDKFDSNGNFLFTFGSGGSSAGQFNDAFGIAVDSNNNIWITNNNNQRVDEFANNNSGTRINTFGISGNATVTCNAFQNVLGIAIDTSGNYYVLDYWDASVKKFNLVANTCTQFGGSFVHPYFLTVDPNGNILVADYGNSQVKRFDSSGNPVNFANGTNIMSQSFNGPMGIATDKNGNIYVVDQSNNRLMKFDSTGTAANFSITGTNILSHSFSSPTGIAITTR